MLTNKTTSLQAFGNWAGLTLLNPKLVYWSERLNLKVLFFSKIYLKKTITKVGIIRALFPDMREKLKFGLRL